MLTGRQEPLTDEGRVEWVVGATHKLLMLNRRPFGRR